MAPQTSANWAIHHSFPPEVAYHHLAHINDIMKASSVAIYSACVAIIFLAVVMRFISRRVGRLGYGADDWILILELLLVTVDSTLGLLVTGIATSVYKGAHQAILRTGNDSVGFAKSLLAGEILYTPTIGIVKISTLLLFARIFPGQRLKRTFWVIGLFTSTYSAIMVITVFFQCRPFKSIWDSKIKAEIIDISKVWIVMANMNVMTNLLLLGIPLPQLWKRQMSRETELQLISIYSIGGFATIISIYRIPQLRGLSFYLYDPPLSDIDPSVWSIVEVSAATLAVCAITYGPLFDRVLKIPSSPSESERKISSPGALKSSGVSTGLGLGSNIAPDVKSPAMKVSHPRDTASTHRSPSSRRDGGLQPIRESPDR